MPGVRTADPVPPKQKGLVRSGVYAVGGMEYLADLDTAATQVVAGCRDVGDDQVKSLGAAGGCRGDVLAEDDRARRARRRELDHAVIVAGGKVGIEPPTQAAIKALGAIDVRNRDDHDFELHIGGSRS